MVVRFSALLRRGADPRNIAIAVAVLLALAFAELLPSFVYNTEQRGADVYWRFAAGHDESAAESRIVIVRIDEDSLARIGPWPWPRQTLARLAAALQREDAQVQLLDIVFPEARPGDGLFEKALQAYPLYLGQIFAIQPDAPRVGVLSGALAEPGCNALMPVAAGYIANQPALARAQPLRGAGHITSTLDADGAVRRIAPFLCHQQNAYPALAVLGVGALAAAPWKLRIQIGSGMADPAAWYRLDGLGLRIPIDGDGTTRLPYDRPSGDFISVSAADVLDGRVPAGLLNGHIALVGATAFGLGDVVPTPLAPSVSGVEIHARLIAALLDGRLVYTPRGAPLMIGAYGLVVGLLLWFLAGRWRGLPGYILPVAGLGLALLAYALHGLALLRYGLWVGWVMPATFSIVCGVTLSANELARTRFERERLFRNLSSYLPRQVAARIALREPVGTLDAERREITVLFADLRNFSAYCEARPPEEAAALLHAFFTVAHRVVSAQGGVVEEFVGDAIMAIWNAPQPCPAHPRRALDAAYALQSEVCKLLPEQAPPGLEPLALGIGIETGKALVGSFGAAERRTHAALGETVTVAARLQAMSAELSADIVVGPEASARLPDAALIDVGNFLLEGLQRPRHLHIAPPSRATFQNADVRKKAIHLVA